MTTLEFALPDGSIRAVRVVRLLNAGYSGRAQDEVVPAQHGRASGEAEWALVVGEDTADPLPTVDRLPGPIG